MWNWGKPAGIMLISALHLASPHVQASGREAPEEFIVKGAGAKKCADFSKVNASQEFRLGLYAGWIEGYLTAYNLHNADTYDITPFQSTKYLLVLLENHCKKNPGMSIFESVQLMVDGLRPHRVSQQSSVLQISSDTHVIQIYSPVLIAAKNALTDAGFRMSDTASFSAEDVEMVRSYQEANSLKTTGVFDEHTLSYLFFRKR